MKRKKIEVEPQRAVLEALGTVVDTSEPFSLTPQDLSRHCYILGSTGCGKTTLILNLIEEDMKRHHSLVILDMRGDLVNGALSLCERLGVPASRVSLLDLREKEKIQGFNPLAGAGEPYIRALHLLEVLRSAADSWGVQLEETLRNALILLASAGRSLTDLEHVLFDEAYRLDIIARCEDSMVVRFWERYSDMPAERQQTWALPVLNKVTSLLAVPVLRAILEGEKDLELGKLLTKRGHILLVSMAVDELHLSSCMMGSLLVSAISREMMARVNVPESKRNPVRLYVDEFENMACSAFENLIAEGRRFKLSLMLSHQTLSQLPAKLRSVIRNNVGIQILFQVGFEDASTLTKELPDNVPALRTLSTGEAIVLKRDGGAELVRFRPPNAKPGPPEESRLRAEILADLPSVKEDSHLVVPLAKAEHSGPDLDEWL
ncbi:MAG: type IV secretion system DNA-binding domain-containing protein [Armatimonadetes bacterium]|nr:type IV secretion system DNA-binding domain-containing protein [Armatimonadota bacterium]